ncbi:MAG: helix-turn-helix domain-containing protein [Flavobacteriaceae bacterium]|nr:helix-turn-helix domain-containing protein [Flavobacteriaceae bacterium]
MFTKVNLHKHAISFGDLKWLKQFMRIGSIVILLWLLAIILNLVTNNQYHTYTYSPLQIGSSFLIYWIGYQGLLRYKLMQDRISLRRVLKKKNIRIEIENKNFISYNDDNTQLDAFRRTEKYLIINEKYLDPFLSLNSLAQEMGMNVSFLSKLINTYSSYNFSDYINQLRVENAKQLLIDNQYKPYTIIAIGLESGFNSKSTFYTAFKKFTGQTPTDYRQQNLDK